MRNRFIRSFMVICPMLFFLSSLTAQNLDPLTFEFGRKATDNIPVNEKKILNYAFEGSKYGVYGDFKCTSHYFTTSSSFGFWVEVPEGNYKVSVVLGHEKKETTTTIKAESRRLMVYDYKTNAGQFDTIQFIVNRRSPQIDENNGIILKSRELDYLNWDDKLTLEFAGESLAIRVITIEKVDVPTIFLCGNSTVVDQEGEPWASWGQMFPLFLTKNIAVANFAESGETLKTFIRARRLEKIASLIKAGDFIFMEFAHNDQKPGSGHVEPFTSYQEYLMKFVALARARGATPVLVTSTNRRKFDENGQIVNTLEEYPDAMRQLAEEENIWLVDLNAMSKVLYETLGVEGSKKAFVHYSKEDFSWLEKDLADNTHFSTYGAWQLAKCVVAGLSAPESPLYEFIDTSWEGYRPDEPDALEEWHWPMPKEGSSIKPDGN